MRSDRPAHRASEGDGLSDVNNDSRLISVLDVLRLATKLAERMVQIRSTGRTLSVEELVAIVKAAEFLHAYNVPWPPVVTEIIDILVAHGEAISAVSGKADVEARLLPSTSESPSLRGGSTGHLGA